MTIKLTETQIIEALSALEDAQLDTIVLKVKMRKQPKLIFNKKISTPRANSVLGVIGKVRPFEEESLEDVLAYRQHSLGLKVDA